MASMAPEYEMISEPVRTPPFWQLDPDRHEKRRAQRPDHIVGCENQKTVESEQDRRNTLPRAHLGSETEQTIESGSPLSGTATSPTPIADLLRSNASSLRGIAAVSNVRG